MSAKFSSNMREFAASALIDAINITPLTQWTATTAISEGDVVFNGNQKYISKDTGTTGTIAPVHISGTASDGGVDLIFVENLNVNEIFNKNLFVSIGKNTDWESEPTADPVIVTDSEYSVVMNNIMSLVRVSSNNFRLGIRRYNWATGTVYDSYDSKKDPIAVAGPEAYTNPFFIFTSGNNIYKCLDNNQGAGSTIEPSSTATAPFNTADGYVWQFMGSLDADSVNHLNTDYVPVRFKRVDDGSAQWDVQEAAVGGALSSVTILANTATNGDFPGTPVVTLTGNTPSAAAVPYAVTDVNDILTQVLFSDYGAGYYDGARVDVEVKAQTAVGSGATVDTITLDGSGTITGITVDAAGSGYTGGAIILFVDPTNVPTTEAVVSVNLTANAVTGFTITNGGLGYSSDVRAYIIAGTSGAIGEAIVGPKEGHGANIVTELGANSAILNVKLSDETAYLKVGAAYDVRQITLITDVIDKTSSEVAYESQYIGPSHPDYGLATLNEINASVGYILYLNHITALERSAGQEESISVVINF